MASDPAAEAPPPVEEPTTQEASAAAEEPAQEAPEAESKKPAKPPAASEPITDGSGSRPRAWFDIDINDTRAAYQRAKDFVEARSLAYSLTSNKLEELGGSEKKRLKEQIYPNDYEWSQKGRICLKKPPERITFELWPEVSPLAVTNFLALCTGCKGKGTGGRELHYKACHMHRLIKEFIIQGGDILMNNGTGGESIYNGKPFKDDKDGLKQKLNRRGLLAMGNSGKNANTSQFFITLSDSKKVQGLTGKHVVFGEIVAGWEVLDLVEKTCSQEDAATDGDKPKFPVVIIDCGLEAATLSDLQCHQSGVAKAP